MYQFFKSMAQNGGKRAGAGRPKGRLSNVTAVCREEAMLTGLLPHQWLLAVCRGEPVRHRRYQIILDDNGNEVGRELIEEDYYPDFNMRLDAAKAAAPFYAPKLATQVVTLRGREDLLNELTDDQIENEIRKFEALDSRGIIRVTKKGAGE